MGATDVIREARKQADNRSIFDRIARAGEGDPDAVIAAVRLIKSARRERKAFWRKIPLARIARKQRNCILDGVGGG